MPTKDLYKVYVSTKRKDGTVIKSESITHRAEDKKMAISEVVNIAKNRYGYKGKIYIGHVLIRNKDGKYELT